MMSTLPDSFVPSRTGPSAGAIEQAIQSRMSSPGWFQKLAEIVAINRYPHLSGRLVPFGRNLEDKPVPGWPDAYLPLDEGGIIAIEATTDGDPLKTHWPNDLEKLGKHLPPEARGGLVWVGWANDPPAVQVARMRAQARDMGLPPARTDVFFRKGICRELRRPCYARLWREELGLTTSATPFVWIEDAPIYGRPEGQTIQPTLAEYAAGLVHVPRLFARVLTALERSLGALIVGHGASGKTTLAILLSREGQHVEHVRGPTYYLDLMGKAEDFSVQQGAEEALAVFGDRSTLFVIDNAHLAPRMAHQLVRHWQALANGSRLLLLSRKVQRLERAWDVDPELADLGLPQHELIIEAQDLEGAYQRLVGRTRASRPVQPVPEATLGRWHELFGGDLIAFSAAVMQRLRRPSWNLELAPSDASDYVRDAYLREFSRPEQEALVGLAAVAEKEILLPIKAFSDDALRESIALGVVWIETTGRLAKYHFFRLAHAGLGSLLLDAAAKSEQAPAIRRDLLIGHPFAAFYAAHVLAETGEQQESRELLATLWSTYDWPLQNCPVLYWKRIVEGSVTADAVASESLPELTEGWLRKAGSLEALADLALRTPLGDLASFLTYAKTAMPAVAEAIHRALADETNREALVGLALRTPLHFHESFLTYAKTAMPEVAEAVRRALADEANREALVGLALRTPLGHLASFLTYATAMPEVAEAVRRALADEANREALVGLALRTPLGDLASFLTYAKTAMPAVAEAIHRALADETKREALADLALRTPLDQLASFLRFAATEHSLTEVRTSLPTRIMECGRRPELLGRFLADGPDQIAAVCREESSLEQVVGDLPLDEWRAAWGNRAYGTPGWFARFAQLAFRVGRADLLEPVAGSIVRNSQSEQWEATGITVRHLTFVVNCAQACDEAEILDFLHKCIRRDWITSQYSSSLTRLGSLAAAVTSIAIGQPAKIRIYFWRPALLMRLRRSRPATTDDSETVGAWLQLLGATLLLGNLSHIPASRPFESGRVAEALKHYTPRPEAEGIEHIQFQLWVGLREWCRLSGEHIVVDQALAETILSQFKNAKPERPRQRMLSELMVEWLGRCKADGWLLAVEERPLTVLLERLENQAPAVPMRTSSDQRDLASGRPRIRR